MRARSASTHAARSGGVFASHDWPLPSSPQRGSTAPLCTMTRRLATCPLLLALERTARASAALSCAAVLRPCSTSTRRLTTVSREAGMPSARQRSAVTAKAWVSSESEPSSDTSGAEACSSARDTWFSVQSRASHSRALAAYCCVESSPVESSATSGGMPPARAICILLDSSPASMASACAAFLSQLRFLRSLRSPRSMVPTRSSSTRGGMPPACAMAAMLGGEASAMMASAPAAARCSSVRVARSLCLAGSRLSISTSGSMAPASRMRSCMLSFSCAHRSASVEAAVSGGPRVPPS